MSSRLWSGLSVLLVEFEILPAYLFPNCLIDFKLNYKLNYFTSRNPQTTSEVAKLKEQSLLKMPLNSQDTDLKFDFGFTSPTSFPNPVDQEQQTVELKSWLLNHLEDPLDTQLLEKLTHFFEENGENPVLLMELYKDCIEVSGKTAAGLFMDTLSSTLHEGVYACQYLMVGYIKGMEVAGLRDIEEGKTVNSNELIKTQGVFIRNELQKGFTDLSNLIKSISPMPSAAVSNETVSILGSLNQFIWEDGKSYKSKIGRLTANRDGSISINLSSAEFHDINILRNLKLDPKHWEYILNRDLNQLISYISSNSEQFKGLDNSVTCNSKIIKFLNNLTSQVPGNVNQWMNALESIEGPRCTLPCLFDIEYTFKIEGPLPTNNMLELIETICVMVLLDWERALKLSQSAKPFLWHFLSKHIFNHLKFNHQKLVVNKADRQEIVLKGLSEGLCQENVVTYQNVCGDRTWELTDNCDKYVTVEFSYKTDYQTFQISKKKDYRNKGFKMMKAPPADARARLIELETQLSNVKTTDQSEFLKPLLYLKRDDSKKAPVPLVS